MKASVLALGSVLVTSPSVEAANTASGSFRYGTFTTRMTSACALRVPKEDRAKGAKTVVVLSDKTLDCLAADSGFDPVGDLVASVKERKGSSLTLVVADSATEAWGWWESSATPESFDVVQPLRLTTNTARRLAGRWATEEPLEFSETLEFDITFDADVLAGAVSGTPLPAGGGEAGQAYVDHVKAWTAGDAAAIARLLPPAEAKQVMDASRAPYFKEFLDGRRRMMMMSEVLVTGGTRRGSKVTLDIEGTGGDGFVWGQVFLELVGGSWRRVGQKLSWRRNR